ncbi:hypothetical protein Ddye_005835 [Dipteronia dyeriana]|uniref:Uncharacterized protein n=1 Tax=Dipteronia dyeriana TaxID=168575 RepID=A0AAD9XHA1_9ROSI|nr:hypothetical protein Ddye_005835 [Dipteronia dyeriana]
MEGVTTKYYCNLFASVNPSDKQIMGVFSAVRAKVTIAMNIYLLRKFSVEEVIIVIKQIDPLKALRPDGLLILFFPKFWDIVWGNVISVILDVLNSDAPLDKLGEAVVILIPKVKNHVRVAEFRPISLYNMAYKIVANRLEVVLERVISPN